MPQESLSRTPQLYGPRAMPVHAAGPIFDPPTRKRANLLVSIRFSSNATPCSPGVCVETSGSWISRGEAAATAQGLQIKAFFGPDTWSICGFGRATGASGGETVGLRWPSNRPTVRIPKEGGADKPPKDHLGGKKCDT